MADIIVGKPLAGQQTVYSDYADVDRIVYGSDVQDFTPDRVGDDFVLTFDDGSSVVFADFYGNYGSDNAPSFETQGVVFTAEDYFNTVLGLPDLMPALGPGETTLARDGSERTFGNMNLLTGIDRIGGLDLGFTDSYELTDTINALGEQGPDGVFDWDIFTPDPSGLNRLASAVYEDARPYQHLGGDVDTVHRGQIDFNFTTQNGTVVDSITLWGFHVGTEIFIDGVSQGIVTSLDQPFVFSHSNFTAGGGVTIIPPLNSDLDMDISGQVRMSLNGQTATVNTSFIILVDAVADRPEFNMQDSGDGVLSAVITNINEYQLSGDDDPKYKDYANEVKLLSISVSANFGDATDGSERHYIELTGIPSDWTVINETLPAGWTYLGTITVDGVVLHRFEVTNAGTVDGVAETRAVAGTIQFNPHDWTSTGATDDNGEKTDWGRHNDGSYNKDGAAQIQVRAVAEDYSQDGTELDDDNNYSASDWSESTPISITEDTPDFTVDKNKDGQGGFDNIIANLGMGEALTGGGGHGSGEFYFYDEQRVDTSIPKANQLGEDFTNFIKQYVAEFEGGEGAAYNKGTPLGIQHANGANSVKTTALTGGRNNIEFDVKSDGLDDGRDDVGANAGKLKIEWDADAYKGSFYNKTGQAPLYAKPTGELMSNTGPDDLNTGYKDGYAELQFRVETVSEGGQEYSILVGFYYAGDPQSEVVALIGIITPNYATGQADVTFIEYGAIYHPGGNGAQNLQSYFQVKLTDDDGDVTYGHVQVRILDDVSKAGAAETVTFDEKDGTEISGNVLVKTNIDHDNTNDGAKEHASSGSDGWYGGGSGDAGNAIVSYSFVLPNGYYAQDNGVTVNGFSVLSDGKANLDLLGEKTYTIYDGNGNLVGTLNFDTNGNYTFAKGSGLAQDVDIKVNYTVMDADGDTSSSSLTIKVDAYNDLQLYIKGDTVVYEEEAYGKIHDPAGSSGAFKDDPWNYSGDNNYTVATYNLFWMADGFRDSNGKSPMEGSYDPTTDGVLYSNSVFSFDIGLRGVTGKSVIGYGSNEAGGDLRLFVDIDGERVYLDKAGTDISHADYVSQPDLNSLFIAAMNEQFADQYGDGNVVVTSVTWKNGWPTLKITVQDGVELQPITLRVEATDDSYNDSGERYRVEITDVTVISGGTDDSVTAVPDPDNAKGGLGVNTDIYDGMNTGHGSGMWIGLIDTEVYESTTEKDANGKVVEPKPTDVDVTVRLYEPGQVDEHGRPIEYTGKTPPVEAIKMVFGYGEQTATADGDYVTTSNTATMAPEAWVAYNADGEAIIFFDKTLNKWCGKDGQPLPQDQYGNPIFSSVQDDVAKWEGIATIKGLIIEDSYSEGDEDFAIWLESVSGNESSIATKDGEVFDKKPHDQSNNASDGTITILDDLHLRPIDGKLDEGMHYLDGPRLIAFTSGWESNGVSQLYEPILPGTPGDGTSGTDAEFAREITYTLTFNQKAEEDISITLKMDFDGTYGKDFVLLDGQGNPIPGMQNGDSFTITLPNGAQQATFTVRILHDHDSASTPGGLDDGVENLSFTITHMENGEVQWLDDPEAMEDYYGDLLTNDGVLVDDMRGPSVAVGSYTVTDEGLEITLVITPANVAMGEAALATVTIRGESGTLYHIEVPVNADGTVSVATIDRADPRLSGLFGEKFFYMYASDVKGGEMQVDNTVSAPYYILDGGGTEPGFVNHMIVSVKGETISEQDPLDGNTGKTTTYTISTGDTGIGNWYPGTEAKFTIYGLNNSTSDSDFEDGTLPSVSVSLTGDFLNSLNDADPFTMTIAPGQDDKGFTVKINNIEYSLVDDGNGGYKIMDGQNQIGTISGSLPSAYNDNYIEGTEQFTPILGDTEAVYPAPEKPGKVDVLDNDVPKVQVEVGEYVGGVFTPYDSDTVLYEGDGETHVVRVALTDVSGNSILEIPSGADPIVIKLEIEVTGPDGRVALHTETVIFHPGQSCNGYVNLTLPDNFLTQEDSTFNVKATIVSGDYKNTSGASDPLIVTEEHNGPLLSIITNNGVTSISEAGSVEFVVKLDTAASEPVKLTMALDFDDMDPANSADGFTPDDVSAIKIGSVTFNLRGEHGEPLNLADTESATFTVGGQTLTITRNGDSWEFKTSIDTGMSAARVTIVMYDDKVTENTETLTLRVVDADGSEVRLPVDPSASVKVTDHSEGPALTLSAEPITQEGEDAIFNVSLSKATVADTSIALQLGAGWENLVEGTTIEYSYMKDGSPVTENATIGAGGKFSIILPAGVSGKVSVHVPTQDNTTTDPDRPLELSFDGSRFSGEASAGGVGSYNYSIIAQDGNSVQYSCGFENSGGAFSTPDGKAVVTYALNGFNSSLGSVYVKVGGTGAYIEATEANGMLVQSSGKWYIVIIHNGSTLNDVIRIETSDKDAFNPRTAVTISGTVSLSAETVIVDETDPSLFDGPLFSIATPDAVTEGSSVIFALSAANSDVNVFDIGSSVRQEPIVISFSIANGGAVTLSDNTLPGYSFEDHGNGSYTLTIAVGADLTTMPSIVVATADNDMIGANPDVDLTITNVSGHESSFSNTEASGVVLDDDGAALAAAGFDPADFDGMTMFSGNDLDAADLADYDANEGAVFFGTDGPDTLIGGDGDDFLYGGDGVNHLYGGDGNDVLVYSAAAGSTMDGGDDGIDFLIGIGKDDFTTLDSLLNANVDQGSDRVSNIEAFVMGDLSLTEISGLQDAIATSSLDSLSDFGWSRIEGNVIDTGNGDYTFSTDYTAYHNSDLDATIFILNSSFGG